MTGPSSKRLRENLDERRKKLLGELEGATQRQLDEHERALQQLLNDARRTTENAIREQSHQLDKALSNAATQQRQQLEAIEQRLSTAATQAERLSQAGGIRSWTRPLAITAAVMIAVGGVAGSGLLLIDRLIASRMERLATLKEEIQRAEQMPKLLPQGVEIREIQGGTYLVGIDPRAAWTGSLQNGTPVIELTNTRD